MKNYDATVIFPSSLREDGIQKNVEKIKGEIAKLGGSVESVENVGLRSFARRLKNKDAGQYVNIRFGMDPKEVNTLRARLKLNEEIFRVQVVNATPAPTPAKQAS